MQRGHIFRYGVLGLPLAFGALPIYIFVPDLYARSGLLGLSAIGAVLVLTRLLDAITDPLFGWLIDRFPSKPMLYVAMIPFAFGFYGLFRPAVDAALPPAIWLFLTLAFCTLGFSATMIAYQAWGGDLGADTSERLQLTGSREAFTLCGVVIAAMSPGFMSSDPIEGMRQLPWMLFAFLVAAWLALRKLPAGNPSRNTLPLWSRLTYVCADPLYRRLLGIFCANGIASSFPATLFVFYVADVLKAPAQTVMLLATYFLTAAIGIPLWVRCVRNVGRPNAWMLAMLLAMGAFLGAAFLGPGDWRWFLLICIVSGFAVGTDLMIPASIVADLGELRGGTGTYFGVWNLVAKLNLALAAGVSLPLLALCGYEPGVYGHEDVLIAVYVMLPIALKIVAFLLLFRWRHGLSLSVRLD